MTDKSRTLASALSELLDLHILQASAGTFSLMPMFRAALQSALLGTKSACASSFGTEAAEEERSLSVSVAMLDKFALESWQSLLYSLTSSSAIKKRPAVHDFCN